MSHWKPGPLLPVDQGHTPLHQTPFDWEPEPVPFGLIRYALVRFDIDHRFPAGVLYVAWNDQHAVVRSETGELYWYEGGPGFVMDGDEPYPQAVVEDGEVKALSDGVPVRPGMRWFDAIMVRSVQDVLETVGTTDAFEVVSDGVVRLHGYDGDAPLGIRPHRSVAEVRSSTETGVVLEATGTEGRRSWRLELLQTAEVKDDGRFIGMEVHVEPPHS